MDTESLKQKLRAAVLPNCKLKLAMSKLLIDKFVKKLSVDDLVTLANLVTSEETESALSSSQCLLIEFATNIPTKRQLLRIKNRCFNPILCCIQMWRWGPFNNMRALMHQGFIDPNVSKHRVCINPYHYESTEPEKNNDNTSSTDHESVIEPKQVQSTEMLLYDAPPEDFSKNKCRVCLTTGVLFDWHASVTDADHEVTYAECFYESTQLPDDMEDKLPQFLCCNCKNELTAAYIFICKARQADRMLRLKQENQNRLHIDKIESGFEWVAATTAEKTTNRKDSSSVHTEHDVNNFVDQLAATAKDDNGSLLNTTSSDGAEERNKVKEEEEDEAPLSALIGLTGRRQCVKTTTMEKVQLECKHCTKMFPREWQLRRHIARCQKQSQFLCHACPRIFKDTGTLRQHTLTHEPNRKREFNCEVCHLKFYTRRTFTSHSKTHDTNRKPQFACDLCDKIFLHKGSLKLHQKLHTGEHVSCQVCDKRYLRLIDLKIHLRTHSGDMPHKCHHTDCDRAFTQASLLNKHLRDHEGYRYKCDICDKEYNQQSTLIQHLKEHTGLPLKCALCDKGFVKRSKISRHIKGVHKVEDIAQMDIHIISVKTEKVLRRKPYATLATKKGG